MMLYRLWCVVADQKCLARIGIRTQSGCGTSQIGVATLCLSPTFLGDTRRALECLFEGHAPEALEQRVVTRDCAWYRR